MDVMLGTFKEIVGEKDMPTMVEIWKAEGKAETGRNMVLAFLRGKFGKVPNDIEEAICQMNDPIALESLAARTANCKTLDEFVVEL